VRAEVPRQLLQCPGRPDAPAENTEEAFAIYVLALVAWGDECAQRLSSVRQLVTATP